MATRKELTPLEPLFPWDLDYINEWGNEKSYPPTPRNMNAVIRKVNAIIAHLRQNAEDEDAAA